MARTCGEAGLVTSTTTTLRFLPAAGSDPPRLLLYTVESVRAAIRIQR